MNTITVDVFLLHLVGLASDDSGNDGNDPPRGKKRGSKRTPVMPEEYSTGANRHKGYVRVLHNGAQSESSNDSSPSDDRSESNSSHSGGGRDHSPNMSGRRGNYRDRTGKTRCGKTSGERFRYSARGNRDEDEDKDDDDDSDASSNEERSDSTESADDSYNSQRGRRNG